MCELCAAKAGAPRIARRNFLRLASVTAVGFAIAPRAFAKETKTPPKPENVLSPDAALDRLMKAMRAMSMASPSATTSSMNARR